ncbi:uncharacterized protein [Miscanthus floridulus]|uniref:uncharacterized protein n=1 Tax=Miscanthus floridulus TaxID=154761 RepID=UPI00345B3FDC
MARKGSRRALLREGRAAPTLCRPRLAVHVQLAQAVLAGCAADADDAELVGLPHEAVLVHVIENAQGQSVTAPGSASQQCSSRTAVQMLLLSGALVELGDHHLGGRGQRPGVAAPARLGDDIAAS